MSVRRDRQPAGVRLEDLDAETLERLGIEAPAKPRKPRAFTAEHERRFALKILASIADLDQSQRARVLRRAQRINEV